jgi:predicted lipid-binding transport protein (Tim44 family)
MRAGALAAIGAIVVLVAVSGCDGGGESAGHLPTDTVTASVPVPTTSEPSTPATTTPAPVDTGAASSPAASTTGASRPSDAPKSTAAATSTAASSAAPNEHSKAGAIAAANAYIRAVDHAYATGDVGPLKTLTAPECRCTSLPEQIAQGKKDGYKWTGDRLSVLNSNAGTSTEDDGRTYTVFLLISQTELTTVGPDGKPFEDAHHALGSEPAHPKVTTQITLAWKGGAWIATRVISQDAA